MRMVFVILLACAAHGYAEEGTRPDRSSPPMSARGGVEPQGDRVVLRSGLSLRGIRVLSESSIDVRVEVLPGQEPLILPAGQVIEVIYDSAKSIIGDDRSTGGAATPMPVQELLPARKMNPAFSKKLAAAMVDRKRVYANRDIVYLLEEVASEHDMTIEVGDAIQALPPSQRQVTLSVTPEQSLEEFLRRVLTEAAPWLRVETQFDEVHVSLRPEGRIDK